MTDSELAVLALVAERKASSGYGLVTAARARGMERWAGLSSSSVYKGLRRLEAAGLVQSVANEKKHTPKGPLGRANKVTRAGARALRQHLFEGLVAPEQSVRFRLSLAFVEVVGVSRSIEQLHHRSRDLEERIANIERARADQGDSSPLGASLLFEYVLQGLKQEHAVTFQMIALLNSGSRP
jgi:DNA-binding PadR family transcriptional regulator